MRFLGWKSGLDFSFSLVLVSSFEVEVDSDYKFIKWLTLLTFVTNYKTSPHFTRLEWFHSSPVLLLKSMPNIFFTKELVALSGGHHHRQRAV